MSIPEGLPLAIKDVIQKIGPFLIVFPIVLIPITLLLMFIWPILRYLHLIPHICFK